MSRTVAGPVWRHFDHSESTRRRCSIGFQKFRAKGGSMGSLATFPKPVQSKWPTGWQMAVDPATRTFLDVLRRLRPGDYARARVAAEHQVEDLVSDVVPGDVDQSVAYDELARRLDIESEPPD